MYTLAVKRDFIAQHALIGGDWGAENLRHSHHYVLELQIEGNELDQHGYLVDILDVELQLLGSELDQHGYLVDILDVELQLGEVISRYRDHFLNDFPEFANINPSLERFAAILCKTLSEAVTAPNIETMRVLLWENEIAWAAFEVRRMK